MKLFIIKHTTAWLVRIIGIYAEDAKEANKIANVSHHELLHTVDVIGVTPGIAFTNTIELENYEG